MFIYKSLVASLTAMVSFFSYNACIAQTVTAPPRPKNAIILFSGKQEEIANNWTKRNPNEAAGWKITGKENAMMMSGGDIATKEKYTDFQLHLEFKVPYKPDAHGQERGNSGVFLQGRYEIQVLDSYDAKEPGTGDCGAVYNQHAPLVNAYKRPLEWQTYDITYKAPRFDDTGKMTEKAHVNILLNGVCIQNNQQIEGQTGGEMDRNFEKPGPILLQDHGNPVEYRNIWILPLPLQGANHYEAK